MNVQKSKCVNWKILHLTLISLVLLLGSSTNTSYTQATASKDNVFFYFDIYSLDEGTQQLYSKYFDIRVYINQDKPLKVAYFSPREGQSWITQSIKDPITNMTSWQYFYLTPIEVIHPWSLTKSGMFPYTTYTFNILIGFNRTVNFEERVSISVKVPSDLQRFWIVNWDFSKFNRPINNDTLASLGFKPTSQTKEFLQDIVDFYLLSINIIRQPTQALRLTVFYWVPALGIMAILIVSFPLGCRKLKLRDSLAVFLGSAFFTLPLLATFATYSPSEIPIVEWFLYVDVIIAIISALVAIMQERSYWERIKNKLR